MGDKKAEDGSHLDIYMDKYELHQNGDVTTYYQGFRVSKLGNTTSL